MGHASGFEHATPRSLGRCTRWWQGCAYEWLLAPKHVVHWWSQSLGSAVHVLDLRSWNRWGFPGFCATGSALTCLKISLSQFFLGHRNGFTKQPWLGGTEGRKSRESWGWGRHDDFFWTPKSSWLNMTTVSSLEIVDDVNGIVDPTLCWNLSTVFVQKQGTNKIQQPRFIIS